MKHIRIPALCLVLCLMLALGVSAASEYVPDSFHSENVNGVQRVVKTYTLPPDADPGKLWEEPFTYDGFTYTWAYTTREETPFQLTKEVAEAQTVNTEKNDLKMILEVLPNRVEYDDGEYSGVLFLDHTSLVTEVSSYEIRYTTVTDTKTIPGLNSNDMSYVPVSSTKNGMTLPLASVDWQVTATALVGDDLLPSQYQAVATYSASGAYQAATGYVTTAEYKGTVTASGIESIAYTVVFTGEAVAPVETDAPAEDPADRQEVTGSQGLAGGMNLLGILAVGLVLLLIAATIVAMYLLKKNIFVYVPGDTTNEYRVIAKFRGASRSHEIDISGVTPRPEGNVAIEIKQPLAKKLLGSDFTIRCGEHIYTYKVRRDRPSDWHEFNIETHEEVRS